MAAGMIAMSLYIMMLLIFVAQIIKYKKSEHKKIKIEIVIGSAIHFRKEISKIKGLIMSYALAFCLLTLITETLFVLITRIVDVY